MPPRALTVPGNEPTPLIPNPHVEDAEGTIAGLKVVPAKQLTRDAFNALFYAYPGVGKTTVAGMFAAIEAAQDVLLADAEGGASVLSHLDHVDVVQLQKWPDVERLLVYLERTPLDKMKYRTVCFDNVTELQTMHLSYIVGAGTVEIQHYGRNTAEMMRFARRVRDLSRFRGINTVLIGWQETKENKSTKLSREVVALTEKLSARLPGVPNVVGHITILDNPPLYTRKLSFSANPKNDAKFRRSGTDDATPIPDDIYYGLHQNPIADILRTLYEGVPFPTAQYQRPKGRTPTITTTNAGTDTESESSTPIAEE